jgi:hypothetical protein
VLRVNRDARISLALRIVEMARVSPQLNIMIRELMDMALGLLETNEIRVLCFEPAEQAFGGGGADSANIHCDDAHRAMIATCSGSATHLHTLASTRDIPLTHRHRVMHRRARLRSVIFVQAF